MIFGHWKNIVPVTHVLGEDRTEGHDVVALRFVFEIPEGVTREDVVAKLLERYLGSGERIEKTDGLGFEKEWPEGVRRRFDTGRYETWNW